MTIQKQEILDKAAELHPQIIEWRRTIHQNPELSFNEYQTARLVTGVLHDLGIEAETGVAKTGVVGHIVGGTGPTVGLRADMDALPILEENGSEFDSQNAGIMHACGHDAHTAILMGAATILKGFADEGRLNGNVRLLFQPSEENSDDDGKSGGFRMVEEGALDDIDAVFGLHVDPGTPVGTIGTRVGPMMAAADMFHITIRGFGGHGARPNMANDPIVLASHVINAVQNIMSRRVDPLESGVISICTLNAGTALNVIPETVEMGGTMRSMKPEVRQQLKDELHRACSVAEALGGSYELTIGDGYPPLINDKKAAETAFAGLTEMLGDENVFEKIPVMASEDFSLMMDKAPGCFMRLGVQNADWDRVYPVHTSTFRMDEDALRIGAASLAACVVEWLENES